MKKQSLLKKTAFPIIDWMHRLIFKQKVSEDTWEFINKLTWIFFGTGFAKLFLFIIQIYGGRVLGEEIYGAYALIMSLASLLMIPLLIPSCANSILKYVPMERLKKKKGLILSTSFKAFSYGFIAFIIIYLIGAFTIDESIFLKIKLTKELLLLGIVGTIIFSLYTYSEAILRSLNRQKVLGITAAISHTIMLIVFFVLVFNYKNTVLSILIPVLFGYLLFALSALKNTASFLKEKFDKPTYSKLFKYNKYLFIVSIATVISGNVDKLMLNGFLDQATVGVYQAYFMSSTVLTSAVIMVFTTVFLPTISKYKHKKPIFEKTKKLLYILTPILLIGLPFQIFIVVKYIYNYPFFFNTTILFTVSTAVIMIGLLFSNILFSMNINSVKQYSKIIIFSAVLNIILNVFLIQEYFLTGAVLATTISQTIQTGLLFYVTKKNIGLESKESKNEN